MLGYVGPVTVTVTVTTTTAIAAGTFTTLTGVTATAKGKADGIARTSAAIGAILSLDAVGAATVLTGGVFAAGANLMVGTGGTAVLNDGSGVTVAKSVQASTATLLAAGGAAHLSFQLVSH